MGSVWLYQADYYRAMAHVEKQIALQPGAEPLITPGHLLAMVDALQAGTLNDIQRETVQALDTEFDGVTQSCAIW
jgi:hypothetical protein